MLAVASKAALPTISNAAELLELEDELDDDAVDPNVDVDPVEELDEFALAAADPTVEFPAVASSPTATLTAVTVPDTGVVNVAPLRSLSSDWSVTLADSSDASSDSICAPRLPWSSFTVVWSLVTSCWSFCSVTCALASVCCAVVIAWLADVTAWVFLICVLCSDSWSTWMDCSSWVMVFSSAVTLA